MRITGRRADAGSTVFLAGHRVTVQGARQWRVSVPLNTIRDWLAPGARTIAVKVDGDARDTVASLPVGLLGQRTELSFLEVRSR